jgi:hypothetical protein
MARTRANKRRSSSVFLIQLIPSTGLTTLWCCEGTIMIDLWCLQVEAEGAWKKECATKSRPYKVGPPKVGHQKSATKNRPTKSRPPKVGHQKSAYQKSAYQKSATKNRPTKSRPTKSRPLPNRLKCICDLIPRFCQTTIHRIKVPLPIQFTQPQISQSQAPAHPVRLTSDSPSA